MSGSRGGRGRGGRGGYRGGRHDRDRDFPRDRSGFSSPRTPNAEFPPASPVTGSEPGQFEEGAMTPDSYTNTPLTPTGHLPTTTPSQDFLEAVENLSMEETAARDTEGQDGGEEEVQGEQSAEALDMAVKHPLNGSWTLWYDNPGHKRTNINTYGSGLQKVYTFSTIEDFWSVFDNVIKPSELTQGSNYHLFRDGVEPKWEDPANAQGGKWLLTLGKKHPKTSLDKYWENVVLACIGEVFPEGDVINGVVISLRKSQDKIALWLSVSDFHIVHAIGDRMQVEMELPADLQPIWEVHADKLEKEKEEHTKLLAKRAANRAERR